MVGEPEDRGAGLTRAGLASVETMPHLAELLRRLRRRDARRRGDSEVTYRELAMRTGWSHAAIGEYFTGRTLPPTDRFDELVRLLGASPAERGALGTARDQVEERRRAGLTPPEPAAFDASGSQSVPRQLPADVHPFTGRTDQLAELDKLLDADGRGSSAAVCAVSGTPGVGKTTLVVHWAHRVQERFPDGQLYVNLRGFDPSGSVMGPAEAVRGFLEGLGVPPQRMPVGLDAQAALYRSLLAGRRMLVVLDNARDADQVRPLLPGAAGCLAVVTSRNQLSSLVAVGGAHPLTVDLLAPADARRLLGRRLGDERVAAEPSAVEAIVACCAGLPLALAIVAARAATYPRFPLAILAGEVCDARVTLDAFAGGDPATDVRALFSWSYRTLSADTGRLFRLLGLHPGPDISAAAAASLVGLPVHRVRPLLVELVRAHLVTEHLPGRYAFHDLLRAYAVEQAHTRDTPGERLAAVHRTLDHYLHTANAADRILSPHRDPITPAPPCPGAAPERVTDQGQAMAWFSSERRTLLAAADWAAATGFDTHSWQLAFTLTTFLDRGGHWHDWTATQHAAVEAAVRLADRDGQARAYRDLARGYGQRGRLGDAYTYFGRALGLYAGLGDQIGEARTHLGLGWVLERWGRHQEALEHAQRALDLFQLAGHRFGQARSLNCVGWYHALLGDHQRALTSCQRALALHRELGDASGMADTWDSLGLAHHHLGRHREAVDCYRRSIELYRQTGDRYNEADTLISLGEACLDAGDVDQTGEAWQLALAVLDDLDHPDAAQVRARLLELGARPNRPPGRTA